MDSNRFFEKFSHKYRCGFRSKPAKNIKKEDLQWSDIVICIRSQSILEADIIKIAKRAGKMCALLIDDNFFAIKDHHIRRPLQENALYEILKVSDFIISGNDKLVHQMQARGSNARYIHIDTVVHENEIFDRNFMESSDLNIVYYDNEGVSDTFDKVISPIIPTLYAKYGSNLHWTFLSVHPDLTEWSSKMDIRYIPKLPLDEFRAFLRNENFNIGIAPLIHDAFTECKYINKFIEYTKAGIPCIYSAVEPYRWFIQNGVNGILCDNIAEEWETAFDQMSDPKQQRQCIEAAQSQLKNEFSEDNLFERIIKDNPELITFNAPKNMEIEGLLLAHIHFFAFRTIDPFIRAWGRFQIEGFKSVCKWTWNHYIRRRR